MYKQNQRILDYLKKFKTITAKEAQDEIAVGRLASRIHDLREQGYQIQSKFVTGVNRYGYPTRYKIYWLEEDSNEQI